jgi:hypothetical protein
MGFRFLDVKYSILMDLNWLDFTGLMAPPSSVQHLFWLKLELSIQILKIRFLMNSVNSIYSDVLR